jgi:conjugal transfer pilus assembly protein TraB
MGTPGALTAISSPSSFRSKAVRKISLSLKNARTSQALKSVDNTIPAGAFAGAVLLGGVDASASIQASSDPRPALLRLTDAGTLPRKFRSDLKGCHALAACYGDISSERVFMRLEKLTCTERKTGEIVEVKVQGYVAGEDGRTGVRGSVVDRAGESMRNVLMGGFLGGVGEFLSQSQNAAVTFSPVAGLAQTNPMGMKDMLKHGAGKGLHNALDKYADFYIKRAEQLQPVIQVAAGRQVDIVFTEGVSIGESVYRQAIGRSNDQERYQQIQLRQETGTPVTDWPDSLGADSSGTSAPGANSFGTGAPDNPFGTINN